MQIARGRFSLAGRGVFRIRWGDRPSLGRRQGVLQMQWFFSLQAWQQACLASLMTYGATTLGACLVFFSGKLNSALLTALTGGAAGIMIAASFFSLLLPALGYETPIPNFAAVTISFFLGGALVFVSDAVLSRKKKEFRRLSRKNGLMLLAMTLHNIPEGMAVGVAFAVAPHEPAAALSALLFAVGIAIQNFPEGACLAFPLRADGMSPRKSFFISQASGAVEIPACLMGAVAATFITGLLPWALAFSAGAMIAVVCSELIPECFEQNKTVAAVGVISGFCLMMLLDLALG